LGQTGTVVFLASDLMLFSGFFAAYFFLRADATVWPPADVELDVTRAVVATAVLLASSVTLQVGIHRFERAGDLLALRRWTLVTALLGGLFLANQLLEYAQLPFGPSSHAYGSAYAGLTGLHAVHVAVGVALLVYLAVRATPVRSLTREVTAGLALVWHLVDLVWIGVFLTVFVIR
jgi:cytochrome c oxidase subunit III